MNMYLSVRTNLPLAVIIYRGYSSKEVPGLKFIHIQMRQSNFISSALPDIPLLQPCPIRSSSTSAEMPVHDFFTSNAGGDGKYLQLFERFLSLHSDLDKISDELQRIIGRCYPKGDLEWCGELGPQFHELHDAWSKAVPKASEKADLGELERLVKASYMIFDHLHTWQTDEHKITAEKRTKKLLRDLQNSVNSGPNNESMTEGENSSLSGS